MNKKQKNASLILGVCGRYEEFEANLARSISFLEKYQEQYEIITVLDGVWWNSVPLIQTLKKRIRNLIVSSLEEESHLPAVLFNHGSSLATGKYLAFLWPTMELSQENLEQFNQKISTDLNSAVLYLMEKKFLKSFPHYPPYALQHAWLLTENIFPLSSVMIKNDVFKTAGGFDVSFFLQRYFDWEYLVFLSKNYKFECSGEYRGDVASCSFDSYPFVKYFPLSLDLVHRYILRKDRCFPKGKTSALESFLNDLPLCDSDLLKRKISQFPSSQIDQSLCLKKKYNLNYKVLITGGFWEYIHNKLCFYNYFDHLQNEGFGTYKTLTDAFVEREDLLGCDLVIISRGRCENIKNIITWAKDLDIPTLYMIDDNWLTVAKDWPDPYGPIFSPGCSSYENFVYALKMCSAVLVYNKIMREDVSAFSNNVYMLPVNIALDLFSREKTPKQHKTSLLIGYAGSIRYTSVPFEALAKIAKKYNKIEVLLFGSLLPEQEALFKGCSLQRIEYLDYEQYARKVSELQPDILLAPLDSSRTSQSKCPNKYLEIAAMGAAGIYSNYSPYSDVIRDRENGLLVKDTENLGEWEEAITTLIEDSDLLDRIKKTSYQDVLQKYDLPVVSDAFVRLIATIVSGKEEMKND